MNDFFDDIDLESLKALERIEAEHFQSSQQSPPPLSGTSAPFPGQKGPLPFSSPSSHSFGQPPYMPTSQLEASQDPKGYGLNSAQRNAVESDPYRPLMILAGPGSGKVGVFIKS